MLLAQEAADLEKHVAWSLSWPPRAFRGESQGEYACTGVCSSGEMEIRTLVPTGQNSEGADKEAPYFLQP